MTPDMTANANPAARKPVVLIVDDMPENLALMDGILGETYDTLVANNGERALKLALTDTPPDLVLLDIMMPGMDGYVVCQILKSDPRTRDVPVIFLTAKTETADEQKGFDVGAVDYITKPVSLPLVLARVKTQIALKTATDFLRDQNAYLEAEVAKRTHEVECVQDVTITAMASLAETRDDETGNHIRRTQNYVRALAEKLATTPKYAAVLDAATINLLHKSAPLHDIGKVGIPDSILLKPGKLTAEEFEVMKTHTTLGRNAILAADKLLDTPSSVLQRAREIAYSHQEKWDGSGYPQGISGDAIPLSAQLMAVADVYDALISKRVYKPAFSHEKAVGIIMEGRGSHFNPDMVDAFVETHRKFHEIAQHFMDAEAA
jgi:putative two-component system response regulator